RNEKSSWEVSFAGSGVPLKIEPSDRHVMQPELSYFKKSSIDYSYLTRDVVSGREGNAYLTNCGRQLMRLLSYPDCHLRRFMSTTSASLAQARRHPVLRLAQRRDIPQ